MVPFNNDSTPDETLCYDGLDFSINEPFLLVSNKPIPKHSKVYIEVTVNSYSQIAGKRNIPIYAGIHKEPAFGVLNSDFCIGSLFYTEGQDFDIMEKYNASATDKHSSPSKIYSRIPGATDIIGIGVDYDNNLITLYNNGKAFYSFSPSLFAMSNETNFYFALWGNINCSMKGYVNFGRNGVTYLPNGYTTLYGYYYRKEQLIDDIICDINVLGTSYGSSINEVHGDINIVNDIMGDGSLFLESDKAILSKNNMDYKILYQNAINYLSDGANVFCNLPIPTDCKVYAEIEIENGVCIDDIIGIPASIGISNSKKTIQSKSMRMPLYHKKWHKYTYTEVLNLMPIVQQITDAMTSIPPEQGKIVGIGMDLKNNSISIYVDKILLYTFKSQVTDFTDRATLYYLFLHDEGVFTNFITGTFNAGETTFNGVVPSGYMSLYDYYNNYYKIAIRDVDIACDINVLPYLLPKNIYMECDIEVIGVESDDEKKFNHAGLNKLMATYNIVTDNETHNIVDKDIDYLDQIIKAANYGYYPDDLF